MEVPPPFAGHVEFVIHRRWVGSQCMHALLQCGLHLLRRFRDTGVLVAVTADSRGIGPQCPASLPPCSRFDASVISKCWELGDQCQVSGRAEQSVECSSWIMQHVAVRCTMP